MQIRIGLENGFEGRSLAWILDYPGCFAYGKDGTEAILRTPQALLTFREWVSDHTDNSWLQDLGDFDIALTEIFECYTTKIGEKNYEVNAWFNDDSRALSVVEVDRAMLMLEWGKTELDTLLSKLTPTQLAQKFPGERWSIEGVVRHVANANWWYLDRLDFADIPLNTFSNNSMERVAQVQQMFDQKRQLLIGTKSTCLKDGETWSARKVIRRAIWHIRDHYFHIERLLTLL
jgi:hypothetical protein